MQKKYVVFLGVIAIFSFFPQVVHGQTSSSQQINLSLSDAIYADLATRGLINNVSLEYIEGSSKNTVTLNESRQWLPASTVKTYAAMYAFYLISHGKLHLTDPVTISSKNEVTTELVTNELPTLFSGETVSLDRLITQMITQSDNTAFNQLLDILGRDNVTSYIQSLGLTHTRIGSKLNLDDSQTSYEYAAPGYGINTTTADDYAKAFTFIKNNRIPGAQNLYTILKQQKINTMIPLFLPKTVVCAHKTGDLDPLYHDGGICQEKTRTYILTIFTNAGDPTLLAHLSEIIYSKDYRLVGQALNSSPLSQAYHNPPLDPLVMSHTNHVVLGAQSINLPVPDITMADLGIQSSDLVYLTKNTQLPTVIIPADSPFHILSSAWQLTKKILVFGPQARLQIDTETAALHLAEAKDLVRRNKVDQAQQVLSNLQADLNTISENHLVSSQPNTQNTIQALSQARFTLFSQELQQSKGNARLVLIKEIANQARDTLQHVQPYTPLAMSLSSSSEKPLIGTIVNSSKTTIIVKTTGGQEFMIPRNTVSIASHENTSSASPSAQENLQTTSIQTGNNNITKGSLIAVVGSNINHRFIPSFIVTNISKELAAPQPVSVIKVDTKNKTMIVSENGVFTQVNITPKTIIKGADTSVPLSSIQEGDVVVVHGEPLQQVQPSVSPNPMKYPSGTPAQTLTPTASTQKENSVTVTPIVSNGASVQNKLLVTISLTPTANNKGKNQQENILVSPTIASVTITQPVTSLIHSITVAPTKSPNIPSPNPVAKTNTPTQSPVIQSVSIQVIEKNTPPQQQVKPVSQAQPTPEPSVKTKK